MLMNTAKRSVKTRHHSNLRPKHKHTKDFLKIYWPYMPLLIFMFLILSLVSPWNYLNNKQILGYATNISSDGLLSETNIQRNKTGAKQLTISPRLNEAAQAKAQDMVNRNYWSHQTPDQQEPWAFITATGYTFQKAGENLAYGFNNNGQVVAGWMNSPTHKMNMLDKAFDEVGFGVANATNFTNNGKSTVVVALYAKKSSVSAAGSLPSTTTTHNVQSKTINRLESYTNGAMPWLTYIVGIITGGALMFIIIKHGIALKRQIAKSERFIIRHPLVDATLLAIVIVGILLTRQAGIIL